VPPPEVEAGLRRLAEDRTSGSLELALAAIDLMGYGPNPDPEVLRKLAHDIAAAQPAMAAVRNAAFFCLTARQDSIAYRVNYLDAVKAFRRFVETSRPKAGRQFLKMVEGAASVVTLSHSSTVLEALRLLHGRHALTSVIVLESLPGGEGRATVEALRAEGILAEMRPDGEHASAVAASDLVLLGADTIYRDGGVANKVGSRALAVAAREAGKRVYVVTETIKLDHTRPSSAATFPPGALFEVLPPSLLDGIATERGVLPPSRFTELSGDGPGAEAPPP